MWTRAELKARGMAAFRANYWMCVLAAFLLSLATGGSSGGSSFRAGNSTDSSELSNLFNGDNFSPEVVFGIIAAVVGVVIIAMVVGIAIKVFLLNPLLIGIRRFFILNRENSGVDWREFGYGFKNNYMNVVKIMFFKNLYEFLWSLLFVIPGIVKGYEYYMIPYLLADDSSISMEEAFATTKKMMTGEKWNTFVLGLSFIGWYILTIFTCGILAIFYVSPYVAATDAELFAALKGTPENTDSYVSYDAAY